MKHLCQEGLVAGAIIDPPCLPQLVYAYGPNGFAQEHLVGRNTNVTGYPLLEGTRAVSSLSFFFPFPFCSCIWILVLTTFLSKFSLLSWSRRSLSGLRETSSWSWLSTLGSCMEARMTRMMMMMMVVVVVAMVREVQSWLWVISRGRGAFGDLADR